MSQGDYEYTALSAFRSPTTHDAVISSCCRLNALSRNSKLLIVAGLVQQSLLGRLRLALLAQPKTLQQCGYGVAEATILQLGIGQHRGARPALAAHLDSFALGALADLVPRRVVEEIGIGLGKAAFLVDRKAGARNDRQAVHACHRRVKWHGHQRHHVRAARIAAYEVRRSEGRDDFLGSRENPLVPTDRDRIILAGVLACDRVKTLR